VGAPSAPDGGIGPPPGQDGASQPTSEFLTPVRSYETIEPETGETVSGGPARAGGGRRRTPIVAAVAAVALVAAGIVLAATAQRDSGPPGSPGELIASADVCTAPACERIQATVTLSWSAPDGRVDRYVVERDGEPIRRLPPSAGQVEIDGLRIDTSYTFGVRAIGGASSGPTSEVSVRTPTPPLEEAQLTGDFRVRETVRSATNLSSVEGIENPRPGSTTTNTWSFDAACAAQAGACPTDWFTWGPLQDHGTHYDGTFRARPATCSGGRTAPTTMEMHLVISHARAVDGRWVADRFRGSMRVSFSCPGGHSAGALTLDGRAD
jgi:hypothetical protein